MTKAVTQGTLCLPKITSLEIRVRDQQEKCHQNSHKLRTTNLENHRSGKRVTGLELPARVFSKVGALMSTASTMPDDPVRKLATLKTPSLLFALKPPLGQFVKHLDCVPVFAKAAGKDGKLLPGPIDPQRRVDFRSCIE
jgi:hypothetical protein